MARGRRKSKSTLELVPDAWERFEKFMKSIVARPSASSSKKSKAGAKRKTGGRKAGRKTGGRKTGARKGRPGRKPAAAE